MTNEEAIEILGCVRSYLASRANIQNEILANHTYIEIANACLCGLKALESQTADKEITKYLVDRPCEVCVFHKEQGCSKWSCVFEE